MRTGLRGASVWLAETVISYDFAKFVSATIQSSLAISGGLRGLDVGMNGIRTDD